MNIIMALLIGIFAQAGLPTPTPIGTQSAPMVTIEPLQSDLESIIATATAEAGRLGVTTTDEQVSVGGRALFPALNSPQFVAILGYAKWAVAGNQSLFGIFAPIVNLIGAWIFVVLAMYVFNLLWRFVSLMGGIAYWIGNQIYKLVELVLW
jgi:hypothetical protein